MLVLYISARYTGFRLNFDFLNIYTLRGEAKEFDMPTIVRYVFSWTKTINPILFGYCLIKRRWGPAALYFASQMFSFGIDGMKTTFFMPFLVLLVVFFYNRIVPRKIPMYLAMALSGFSFLGVLENIVFNSNNLILMFLRRILYLTSYISYCYFDFFQTNTPDFFRMSFLRYFGFLSPYKEYGDSIAAIIGERYFPTAMNANNGLVADAITNMWWLGMIVMPLFLIMVLRLFDVCAHGLDKRMVLAFSLNLSFLMQNSFLLTVLLTHGLMPVCILLALMNRDEIEDNSTSVFQQNKGAIKFKGQRM